MTPDTSALSFPIDARGASSLVSEEIEWRRPSSLLSCLSGPFKLVASHWRSEGVSPSEVGVEIAEPYHTVAIALGATHLWLAISGRTIHDGKVGAGALQISGPGQETRARLNAGSRFLHLHLSNTFLLECREQAGRCSPTKTIELIDPRFAHDATIERLGRLLLRAKAEAGGLGSLYGEGIGIAIVSRLLARHSNCSPSPQTAKPAALAKWKLRRALDYIEIHLSAPLTLADIAAASGLSRMHFPAQFRAATGLGPHEFLVRRRIERAQAIILQGDPPLAHVALEVGFQTQSHFNCVFHRFVGEPPGVWRKANRTAARSVTRRPPIRAPEAEEAAGCSRFPRNAKTPSAAMAWGCVP